MSSILQEGSLLCGEDGLPDIVGQADHIFWYI
jgi:hypothetical protein